MLAHDLQMWNRVLLSLRPAVRDLQWKLSIMMQNTMELMKGFLLASTFFGTVRYLSLKLTVVFALKLRS